MAEVWHKFIGFVRQITVEPVLFCYMLIIFMESNALQSLFTTKLCLKLYDPVNISDCSHKSNLSSNRNVIDEASLWNKYYSSVMTFFTLVSSFYVASWSDRFSRKIPMLIPLIGTLVASIVNITLTFFMEVDIAYYMISAAVSGISFGTVGIIAATFGHLSDIVTKDQRTKRIVILEAMIFVGGTFGIYIGGAILKNTDIVHFFNDYVKVFALEMIIDTAIMMYVIVVIPYKSLQSRNEEDDDEEFLLEDRTLSCGSLFSIRHIKDSFRTVVKERPLSRRKRIIFLLTALAFMYFGHAVQFTVAYLYVKMEPIKWDITEYSYYNSVQFAVEGVALIVGIPLAFHVLHVPDLIIAIIGVLSRIAGLALFGFSYTGSMIYGCAALYVFSEYPIPAVKSALSKLVDEDEKGRIFAFATLLQNVCYFLAAWILPSLFHFSLSSFPGLCFELLAVLQVIALILFCYMYFTPLDIITVYSVIEKDDGSVEETQRTMPIHTEMDFPQ